MKKILLFLIGILCVVGCGSKKSGADLDSIKTALLNSPYYNNHEVVEKSTIEKRYSIDLSNITDVLMITSKSYDDSTMVLIVDKKAENEIKSFVDSYNDQWVKMNYFPEQKELVEKALYRVTNNYVIYIVSNDNSAVLKLINL